MLWRRHRRRKHRIKPIDAGQTYLKVTIVKARNLADSESGKSNSPYAVIRANGYRFSTYTVQVGNQDPEWNTEFHIPLAKWRRSPAVSIIVWNKTETVKSYIGEVIIRLPSINMDENTQWISLKSNIPGVKMAPGELAVKFGLGSNSETDNVDDIWHKFIDNFGGPEQAASPLMSRPASDTSIEHSSDDQVDVEELGDYGLVLSGENLPRLSVMEPIEDPLNPSDGDDFDFEDESDDLDDLDGKSFETDLSSQYSGSTSTGYHSGFVSEPDFDDPESISDAPYKTEDLISLRSLTLEDPSMVSSLESDQSKTTKPEKIKKKRRLKRSKHKRAKRFELKMNSNILGIIFMEIESVSDLPPLRNMTRTNFDMDPFVVISFGKKTFRTPYRRHTLNPVFNENLIFPVQNHEQGFSVNFSVLDKDRLSFNDFVAETHVSVSDILKTAPIPDCHGIYNIDDAEYSSSGIKGVGFETFTLPLTLKKSKKYGEEYHPWLTLRARFMPYTALRQQLWKGLIKVYGTNESGSLNYLELCTMLDSLGSTLSRETIDGFFFRFDKKPETDDLTADEITKCLEDQVMKDSMRESVDDKSGERIMQVAVCPFCNQPRLSKRYEIDIVTHLATCASLHWGKLDALVMGRYVTSRQARKRWYTKVFSKVSYGKYRLGANSANILVQDRITGYMQEEKMSMYVRVGIRLLYKGMRSTQFESKKVRKLLRSLSVKQGRKFDNPASVQSIRSFIKFHKLSMEDVLEPIDKFKSFNEFFYRKLKPGARPCEAPDNPKISVSAADCRLNVFSSISEAKELWIKGRHFTIDHLIGPVYPDHVSKYIDGSVAIFRLAPQDYHRFHSPVDGIVGEPRRIDGEYYTVNPMAIRSALDVYSENVRVIIPIYSEQFGTVTVCCIGAMMVGSIVLTVEPGQSIKRTDELGYFKFGGSTLVVLYEPGRIVFDSDLTDNSRSSIETLVRVGMSIGREPGEKELNHQYELHYSVT